MTPYNETKNWAILQYEADLLYDSLREEGYISPFHKFVCESEEDKKESKND